MSVRDGATIERLQSLTALASEWIALAQEAEASFFLGWGWIGPWAAEMAPRTPLYLFRLRDGGETRALALLTRHRVTRRKGLIRVVQLQLNEHTAPGCDMIIEHNGILCQPQDVGHAWHEFRAALRRAPLSWDELKFRSMGPNQLAAAQAAMPDLRMETEKSVPTWVVRLDDKCRDAEVMLGVFKKKTRQQMRQSLREFEAIGPLTLEIASSVDQASSFFAEMETLHSARWKRVGKQGSFANRTWTHFHERVITEGAPRGNVLLAKVSLAGNAIGFVYGFAVGTRFYALQTGFKPQERTALRSGYVTHFLLMQELAGRGIHAYDFLPDEEGSYKRLLADPAEVLTTLRVQQVRIIFALERVAVALYRRFRQKRDLPQPEQPTNVPAPQIEVDAS